MKLLIRLYFGRHRLLDLHIIPINLLSKFQIVLELEFVVNLLLLQDMVCSLGLFVHNLVVGAAVRLSARCHRLRKCLRLIMRRMKQLPNCFVLVVVAHGADHIGVKHPLVSFVHLGLGYYVVEFAYLRTV